MSFRQVGVVGCGTMGSGIAYIAALKGYKVYMLDVSQDAIDRALTNLQNFSMKSVQRGKLTEKERQALFRRLRGTLDYEDFSSCDIVIEAVAEKMEIKHGIFKKLEQVTGRKTILASNTSSLSIAGIAKAVSTPDRVLGLHFFNPPQLMKLVELIRSDQTCEEAAIAAHEFVTSLEKVAIQCKDNPGFIVNYLQYPFRLNAIRMVEQGIATPEDIDTAAKLALGHKMGPLELQDMVGLDITYNGCMEVYEKTGDPLFKPPELMKRMLDENRLGRKTGKGFYDYSD